MKKEYYTFYDNISGLEVIKLKKDFLNSIANKEKCSIDNVILNFENELNKIGVKYFIHLNSDKIIALPNDAFLKSPGNYFNNFDDAINFLNWFLVE